MKYVAFFLISCLLFSCRSDSKEKTEAIDKAAAFRIFLKKFKEVDLPFVYRYGNVADSLDFDCMPDVDPDSIDHLFIKVEDPNTIKCYGRLKDTSAFFSLIYFYPADSYYPMLVTYTKDGNIIDQAPLIVNGCGSDCGIEYCSETGVIKKDLSIYCTDTVKWKFSCDSLGKPIPDSDVIWVHSKTGKITDDGKLFMHKEQRKTYRVMSDN